MRENFATYKNIPGAAWVSKETKNYSLEVAAPKENRSTDLLTHLSKQYTTEEEDNRFIKLVNGK